jgi:hypothetical protein
MMVFLGGSILVVLILEQFLFVPERWWAARKETKHDLKLPTVRDQARKATTPCLQGRQHY